MHNIKNETRRHLLTTVSIVALLGSADAALAEDGARPVLWIEAGGQFDQLSNKQEPYAPPFVAQLLTNPFTPPASKQAPPRFGFGEEARITFQPEDSDWKFSAGIRYGRANRRGDSHEQTSPASPKVYLSFPYYGKYGTSAIPALAKRFATTVSETHESSTVLDFQVGRDVGLGIFGGSSSVNLGVRFAQFKSRSSVRIDSDPDFHVTFKYITNIYGYPANDKFPQQHWDLYIGRMSASRSFSGVGPSLDWEGNRTIAGQTESGAITFDWGVNAALLFGRQRVKVHQQTTAHVGDKYHGAGAALPLRYQTAHDVERSHSVSIPNVGGFAGLSLRYPNAKISFGYKADFFFNAIDGGIDARKSENRGFFGPYASISIGLGD